MAGNDNQPMRGGEPELNLLLSKSDLDQPLWKSLIQNLDDFFFPRKQPPLVLTSKPIPVKDIWGFYDYKKNGALGSTAVHVLAVIVIIGGTMLGRRVVQQITKPSEVVTLISPDDIPLCRRRKRRRVAAGAAVTAINSRRRRVGCPSCRCSRSLRQWSWCATLIPNWRSNLPW